jgi:hypothetical protein
MASDVSMLSERSHSRLVPTLFWMVTTSFGEEQLIWRTGGKSDLTGIRALPPKFLMSHSWRMQIAHLDLSGQSRDLRH